MVPRRRRVAGATLAGIARSGGHARRAHAGTARSGRERLNDRRIRLEHWVETPRFEPAPPRSSATKETSMRPSLPSRAGPLRDDGEPGIPPDDDAPTPGRQANAPTSGWRSDASPAGALVRRQRTARARTHRPGRARPRPCSPRIAGTVRPRKDRRSSRSAWTHGADRLQAVHRRARSCALAAKARGLQAPGPSPSPAPDLPRRRPGRHRRCGSINKRVLRQIPAILRWHRHGDALLVGHRCGVRAPRVRP